MDIPRNAPADAPRFNVVINGKKVRRARGSVYRFTLAAAESYIRCMWVNNKVRRENIRMVPCDKGENCGKT